jgi:hypothetical protein
MWEARKTVAVPQARGPADLAEPSGDVVLGPLVSRVGEERIGVVELDQQAGAVAAALGRLGREQGGRRRPTAGRLEGMRKVVTTLARTGRTEPCLKRAFRTVA